VLEDGLDVAQIDPSLFNLAGNGSLQSFSGQLGRRVLVLSSLILLTLIWILARVTSSFSLRSAFYCR
jgi:hypothetical protein